MFRQLIAGVVTVLTLQVVLVASQAPPNFSGRWTTDPEPAAAPAAGAPQGQRGGAPGGGAGPGTGGAGRGGRGDMGSGWGSTINVTQNDATLTVEYTFFGRGDMQPPLRFVYDLTGKPTTNTVMMGRGMQSQTARATWDGDKLVLITTHTLADPATGKPMTADVTQTLSLGSSTSLVVETVRAGVLGAEPTTTKVTYRKITP